MARSRYHTLLAASGSVGGTDDHNFQRHLSKSEHVENRAPKPKIQGDLEVSDEVAEQSRHMPLTAVELIKDTFNILYRNFWPLILIFALTDLSMFALHRVSHRITNEAAVRFLGGSITHQSLGNLWFLSNNPSIANFETGYQYLVAVFFLIVFPLNILIRSFASTITILYAWKNAGEPNECPDLKPTFLPPVKRMWANLKCVWPKMRGAVPRVWFVDLLVAVRVLPLQCLSLLLLPLPFTLPRILALQLANPASVVEGWEGDEALKRSDEMTKVKGVKKALLWPYVGLICGMRLVSMGRTPILAALPAHIIRDVPEIPFVIYTSFLFLSVVLSRLQDVLPLAVFKKGKDREAASEAELA
ncbi:hypothetical protein COCOBI_07-1700 [Coccomyxa sp. Obi]|nr:hypothetical protein COCOBI_07-1700 [Coccomyxa sp. Obi]